jgi:sulfite exporter TauE/SafE
LEHLPHLFEILKNLATLEYLPGSGDKVSLGLMFVFGLLTSFHCMGMCGGIVISNSIRNKGVSSSVAYNLGRIFSYTAIGAIAGSLGHAVNFTGIWRGVVPIVGGIFMVLLAIKYLNIFPALRRLNIRMPVVFAKRIFGGKYNNTFIIGLLSGLMPCGPLQMVQLYALSTKSIFIGAMSAFAFSLGTIPVLFAFGLINSAINKKYSGAVIRISAVIVLVLGAGMLGRGLALAGVNVSIPGFGVSVYQDADYKQTVSQAVPDIQVINTELKSDEYPAIVVKKGIPVKWNLKASKENLNDCNNVIIIPKLKIEKNLHAGDNFIEFTPAETGEIVYTCWMGMIKSKIKIID